MNRSTVIRGLMALAVIGCLVGPAVSSGASDLRPLVPPRLRLSLQMLVDVALRHDLEGLELARERLEMPSEEETPHLTARRLYLVALADWHTSQAAVGDQPRSLAAARRADGVLEEAIALDPEMAQLYALRNRVGYLLFQHGALDGPTAMARMSESHRRAMELAPDAPLVALVDGTILAYTPEDHGGDAREGRRRILEAIAIWTAESPHDPHAAIWLPVAWNWLGTLGLGNGEVGAARRAFEQALAVRPDYAFVRNALLPMTEPVRVDPVPDLDEEGWRAVATDPSGDGRFPNLPDLRRLAWHGAPGGERLWFRFELEEPADPDRFGVNLAIDLDGDQATGSHWWAGNTDFTYDRLVTVWVARDEAGVTRGTMGAADAGSVAAGRYVTTEPGQVAVALGATAESILVGVSEELVGDPSRVRVVATVGTNTDWNDTAPDRGSAALEDGS